MALAPSPAGVLAVPSAAVDFVQVVRWRAASDGDRPAVTFLPDGETEGPTLTFAELDARARALAARLIEAGLAPGPVLLVYPTGVDYLTAFLGCLYAGAIAVPAYPPRFDRYDARLHAIAADAGAEAVLTTSSLLAGDRSLAAALSALGAGSALATDETPAAAAEACSPPVLDPEAPAFLQYTSGSTASPRGVAIGHRNLLHNMRLLQRATGNTSASTHVSWLPLHHDLGLVATVLQALYVGARLVLLPTEAFIRRPARWLEAIGRYRGATSLAPNFAFDLCARKVTAEERQGLDLSSWTLALNGAEPVRAGTLERFGEAFASCGFRPETFYPAFGLAEATGFVSGGPRGIAPGVRWVRRAALEQGRVEEAAPRSDGSQPVVGLGRSALGQRVLIVDPDRREPCAEGRVGEVWIDGPSVALGYWRRPGETAEVFGVPLASDGGSYLRTGDLGFLADGELYFTSRLKDLIVIDGANHSPQDLEETAERAHPALRPGFSAAFSVEGDDRELLILAVELSVPRPSPAATPPSPGERADAGQPAAELAAVERAIRGAIAAEHGIQADEVLLLASGTIPRTSSSKIQRRACREAYRDGKLEVVWRGVGAPPPSSASEPRT